MVITAVGLYLRKRKLIPRLWRRRVKDESAVTPPNYLLLQDRGIVESKVYDDALERRFGWIENANQDA